MGTSTVYIHSKIHYYWLVSLLPQQNAYCLYPFIYSSCQSIYFLYTSISNPTTSVCHVNFIYPKKDYSCSQKESIFLSFPALTFVFGSISISSPANTSIPIFFLILSKAFSAPLPLWHANTDIFFPSVYSLCSFRNVYSGGAGRLAQTGKPRMTLSYLSASNS